MSEHDDRLLRCFASVFPELTAEEIRSINEDSAGIWDSLATVTLAAVVQEEFAIEINLEALPQLNSFEAFQAYLANSNAAGIESQPS